MKRQLLWFRDGMQFVFFFPTNININTAKGGSINHGKAS